MARYSIKSVSLSPPHFKRATTRMRLRASLHCVFSTLMCFLNESCESHHSPRNFVDSSTGRSVFPILTMGGLWARESGAVKCMTLHLWAANLKPFLVAHTPMAFTACYRCLSMVSRERPRKQIARSSTKSALKMSLAIQEGSSLIFSPKHVTARTPPVGTPYYVKTALIIQHIMPCMNSTGPLEIYMLPGLMEEEAWPDPQPLPLVSRGSHDLCRDQCRIGLPPEDTQLSTRNAWLWFQETRPHWRSK